MADVPVGAFLSGGVDSSTNVALMSRLVSTPLQTFTIEFTGFGPAENFHDVPYARQVASMFGCRHTEVQVIGEGGHRLPSRDGPAAGRAARRPRLPAHALRLPRGPPGGHQGRARRRRERRGLLRISGVPGAAPDLQRTVVAAQEAAAVDATGGEGRGRAHRRARRARRRPAPRRRGRAALHGPRRGVLRLGEGPALHAARTARHASRGGGDRRRLLRGDPVAAPGRRLQPADVVRRAAQPASRVAPHAGRQVLDGAFARGPRAVSRSPARHLRAFAPGVA